MEGNGVGAEGSRDAGRELAPQQGAEPGLCCRGGHCTQPRLGSPGSWAEGAGRAGKEGQEAPREAQHPGPTPGSQGPEGKSSSVSKEKPRLGRVVLEWRAGGTWRRAAARPGGRHSSAHGPRPRTGRAQGLGV